MVWALVPMSGGRYIRVGADKVLDILDVAAGQPVQLAGGKLPWVHLDPALSASIWQVHQSGLPGHERGQGPHFFEAGFRMVADPAIVGAAGGVMLHSEAVEHPYLAVVHADRHLDQQFPPRTPQHLPKTVVQVQAVGGVIEEKVNLIENT